MAGSNRNVGTLVIVVLALVLLYALNPTKDDFIAWKSAHAQRPGNGGSTSDLVGVMSKGADAMAGAMIGGFAAYDRRDDFLLCSGYSFGGERYLGVAGVFIRLK
jgi:hypothetical protein